MPLELSRYDSADYLTDEEAVVAFLEAAMEEDGFASVEERIAFLAHAYAAVQRARAQWTKQ